MESSFMKLNEYQARATATAVFPREKALEYLTLGLCGEAGELANKVKKHFRGDLGVAELHNAICAELGDCLWYIAVLADVVLREDLSSIAQDNLDKLADRAARGVLKGSGDSR